MPNKLLLLLGAFAAVPTGVAATAQVAASAESNGSYLLGPNDEIQVIVFGQQDMTTKTRIRADGTIIAPFLGAVTAADKTTAQLSQELASAYVKGGYLSKPSIDVEVTVYASKVVDVSGYVTAAGLYPLDRPYTVAMLVARAGGAREGGANAVILKPTGGGQDVRISLADGPAASRLVMPGDRLYIPEVEKIYVYGEVNKGGEFEYKTGMTFRQALALAGGPTLAGSTKRVDVTRSGHSFRASLDDPMQPDDVLVIKEKLF